jgi:hypothetical protein
MGLCGDNDLRDSSMFAGFSQWKVRDSTQGTLTKKLQMNASEITSGSIVGVATLMITQKHSFFTEICCNCNLVRLKLSIQYHAVP